MKLLFDMNLSPLLVVLMRIDGWESIHWSTVGDPRASDRTILNWARKNEYWVITNDLDFGAILAATKAESPSVVQFRTQDVSPAHIKPILLNVLEQYKNYLESGAIISVNERNSRIRILPL
jgi:predicted nuclease of predicted toxin-antitoxin system